MRVDNILLAVSHGFDIVESELVHGAASGHSQRVAALCGNMGTKLGMSSGELITLTVCALFHDCALTEWLAAGGEDSKDHCTMGQYNISTLPLPTDSTGLVTYHHERSDGSGLFGLQNIPLGAEIISLADSYDVGKPLGGFSSEILKVFDVKANNTILPEWHLPPKEAMKLGSIIGTAIDYKSKFTRCHTLGIAEKSKLMAKFYGYNDEETAKLYLAACLHDLGKLSTPTDILEKPGTLTEKEFTIIKNHVLKTHELLEGVDPDIRHWAAGHHEKLDGKGYPFGLKADELHFNAQLMTCIDIYQAVSEERPYHPARSHEQTMELMHKIVTSGAIDGNIVKDLDSVLG